MSDNVERQKSTRWVTEVPDYGDWGDEDYDDYSDENVHESKTETSTLPGQEVKKEHDVVGEPKEDEKKDIPQDHKSDVSTKEAHSETKSPLVLSIDRHQDKMDTDSSDEEEEEGGAGDDSYGGAGNSYDQQEGEIKGVNEQVPSSSTYEEVVPGAFKDDDKIHNASVAASTTSPDTRQDHKHRLQEVYGRLDNIDFVIPPTPTLSEFSGHSNFPETFSEASFQSESSIQREPLNLSVKEANTDHSEEPALEESLDQDREEEQLPDAEKLVLSIDKRTDNNIDDDDSTDDDWGYQGNDTSDEEEEDDDVHLKPEAEQDIDSYINELSGHASMKDDNDSVTAPKLDTTNLEPPNSDLEAHDEIESPIAPLSIAQQHNTYMNEMASRRSSVRKAPARNESGDYSNIFNGSDEEEESSIEPQHSRKESVEIMPPSMDVRSILSSGSLSTGKLSLESKTFQKPETNDDDELNSRRVSQATLNFGNWVPNTDNYRNKFINDNDNESTINFDSDAASKYNKFTKVRNPSGLSDVVSNASSISVPETIDAAMPSIQEDTDDELQQDSLSDNRSTNKLEPLMTQDTLFDSKQKPVFGEERLTPDPSKENLPQKYSSLIPMQDRKASDSADDAASQSRTVSSNSNSTTVVTSAPTTATSSSSPSEFKPKPYPVSNWKAIITISQPVDRIAAFKKALADEAAYETGLQYWLNYTLKQSPDSGSNIHIGRIASQAYQNAAHNDLRRHASLRSKVNVMKDKVEGTGSTASHFGRKLFSRSRKFISGDK